MMSFSIQETTDPDILKRFGRSIHEWIVLQVDLPSWLIVVIEFVVLALIGYVLWRLSRFVLIKLFGLFADRTKTHWDDVLIEQKFFKRLAQFIPAVAAWWLVPDLFAGSDTAHNFLTTTFELYLILVGVLTLYAFINTARIILEERETLRDKPVRSYVQLVKLVIALVAVVYAVSTLFSVSPLNILTGLGAVTAVVLLLFKDTILGLVASVQMSSIDLVRKGDWITMEKYGADGDVVQINLTSVKVQNWDMTITIIPTYALVSDSFKNWRGMQASGGRRIKRKINIKVSTVKFVNEEFITRMKKLDLLKDYIHDRKQEIDTHNANHNFDPTSIDARRMTNIGIFRAYALAYMRKHPKINQDMTCMVRQLEAGSNGVPVEVYAFSKVQEWVEYEVIVGDVFDHLLASIGHFDLEVFQEPTGSDVRALFRSDTDA